MTTSEPKLVGRAIGGWLVLLGISIAGSLIQDILFVKQNLPVLFDGEMVERLGQWRWHFRYEVFVNCFLSVMCSVLLAMFLLRRRAFPKVMINTLGIVCFGLLIKAIWLRFLPDSPPILSSSYARKLGQVLLSSACIIYLTKSDRVKQTFVR